MIYFLVAILVALNIIDLIQTHTIFLINGPEGELNVVARYIYRKTKGNFISIILFKIILIGIAIIVGLLINSLIVFIILDIAYILGTIYNHYVIKNERKLFMEEIKNGI